MGAEEAFANRVEGTGADVPVNDADGGEGEPQQSTASDTMSCRAVVGHAKRRGYYNQLT